MQIELFDARMLAPLVQFLEQHGARSEPLLNRRRIPVPLIKEGGWIGKKQAYDFTHDVIQVSKCREAVFTAYLNFELAHLGPVAAAMKSCRTVKESLDVGLRLGGLAYEGNEYFLRIDGDTTWMCYREPREISAGQTFINDMTLAVYSQLVRSLIGEDWQPERMLIRKQLNPRHLGVDGFEQCHASIHPNVTALALPTKFLRRCLPQQLQASGDEPVEPWDFGPDDQGPNVERLYRLVAAGFAIRTLPTLAHVAEMVDVSQASLKRQLAAAGTTYRGLLDRIRFDEARKQLVHPEISIRTIATDSGYANTSNFVRSFRRMTGMTPGQFRRREADDGKHG